MRRSGRRPWWPQGVGLYSQELLSLGCTHSAKLHWPGLVGHPPVDTEFKLVTPHFTRKSVSVAPLVSTPPGVHEFHTVHWPVDLGELWHLGPITTVSRVLSYSQRFLCDTERHHPRKTHHICTLSLPPAQSECKSLPCSSLP